MISFTPSSVNCGADCGCSQPCCNPCALGDAVTATLSGVTSAGCVEYLDADVSGVNAMYNLVLSESSWSNTTTAGSLTNYAVSGCTGSSAGGSLTIGLTVTCSDGTLSVSLDIAGNDNAGLSVEWTGSGVVGEAITMTQVFASPLTQPLGGTVMVTISL